MTWASRRVLVTGGAGFIGSHLVERLVGLDASVVVLDSLVTGHVENFQAVADMVTLQTVDLRTDDLAAALEDARPDVIFHLAANAYVPPSVERPRWDFETNLLGTFNLLEAARGLSVTPRVVFTSTAAVYAEGIERPLREDDLTGPLSPYGVSKLGAERYMAVYPKLFNVPAVTLRLFPVFGPRLRKQVVYDLLGKIHANPAELFIHGDGTQVRDFNHVSNVIDALVTVAERATPDGSVFNVASGEGLTIADLARTLCQHMGATPRFVYSGQVRAGEAQRWVADTSRLQALGYRPRINVSEGLADTVRWFRGGAAPAPSAD